MRKKSVLLFFILTSMPTTMWGGPSRTLRRFSSSGAGAGSASDPAQTAMHATAASAAASAAAGSAVQAAADAAHAHGDAGSATACAQNAAQAAADAIAAQTAAQQAQRLAAQAATDAATNARHIRNITPVLMLIGVYCFYTSLVLAPKFKRHYHRVVKRTLRQMLRNTKSTRLASQLRSALIAYTRKA